jgi:hypothetical protein
MKKMFFGVSMILACLVFLVPPATAAGVPHGVPVLSDFLASLAGPASVNAAKRPALQGKGLCSATANCVGGGTISCQGNNSTTSCTAVDFNCSVNEPGHVTCDGVTYSCANTCGGGGCGLDFCTGEDACAWNCYPCPYTYTCNETYCTDVCRCNFRQCPV